VNLVFCGHNFREEIPANYARLSTRIFVSAAAARTLREGAAAAKAAIVQGVVGGRVRGMEVSARGSRVFHPFQ
jgi:hypothetical protein